jgi:hypothetical protein
MWFSTLIGTRVQNHRDIDGFSTRFSTGFLTKNQFISIIYTVLNI